MGIPAELRLQIYAYIPEPIKFVPAEKDWASRPGRLFRRCFSPGRNAMMAILRVNKQISTEAMPIIYQNIEFGPMFKLKASDSKQHARHIVLLSDFPEARCVAPYLVEQPYGVAHLYEDIAQDYPRVTEVRICLDIKEDLAPGSKTIKTEWPSLLKLPNLKRVIIEAYNHHSESGRKYNTASWVRDEMFTELVAAVRVANRNIAVSKGAFRVRGPPHHTRARYGW